MPEISLPDIKLPDVSFRDARLRDVKLPDIDLRDVKLPDVDLSKLSLPSALRDFSMPEVSLRDLKAPKVEMPDVDLRTLDPRRLDLSGVDAKRLREIIPFAKPAPKPWSPLPWVVVAAAAGVFAGWWLATSSATGPAVRGAVARVRGRIDEWRASRSDWADAEDRTEGFWSSEDGWKEEGSQPGTGSQPGAGHSGGTWSEQSNQESDGWEGSATAAAVSGVDSDAGVGGTSYEPSGGDFGSESGEREG